ncbi:hypothetical protein CR205_02185 [Alteribacter lacisalsi]|uniref:Tubby C-terminal domain-containing protein n=1 Tax=Alteribacter lacisalsi TaxID=2045244 RepID=A0A2W0HKP4_9BACI|nr:hypothetical protein [Alteribacter lacisalsi]PYZ97429.1 hypothetical protein CR205_02185 [Alteribacter lacisalsi]
MYYEYTSPLIRYSAKAVPIEGEHGTCGYLNLFYETGRQKWLARASRFLCTNAEVRVGTVCVRIVQEPFIDTWPKKTWHVEVNGEERGIVRSSLKRKQCCFEIEWDGETFEMVDRSRGTQTDLVKKQEEAALASFTRGASGLAKKQQITIHNSKPIQSEVIFGIYHLFSLHFTRKLG